MSGEDVQKLVDEFDCALIEPYLRDICEDETNRLSHCFAIQYDVGIDTDKVMCRTVMPKEMSEHFNTRDRMDG